MANQEQTSYRIIAPYYNWLMSHVDYAYWAEYILAIWKKQSFSPVKILELAAGTCRFMQTVLFKPPVRVIETDLSPYMLIQAENQNGFLRTAVNAVAIPFKTRFDLCLMIYDSLNYLLEETLVEQCLKEVYRILGDKSLFIFDITTEYNSKTYFKNDLEFDEIEECAVIRHSWYDSTNKLQYNDFLYFIREKNNRYRREEESHIQRIYSLEQMKKIIECTEFTIKGIYENFTFKKAGKRSERVHYVLQKQV